MPLVLIREASKLPLPTISIIKPLLYISSLAPNHSNQQRIEIERDVVPRSASVVVVDYMLSTGETLYAMLQLLNKTGIGTEPVNIIVVAKFPVHRSRQLLR